MVFLVQSRDGRLRIGTHNAEVAAAHVRRLNLDGRACKVTDANGRRQWPKALTRPAMKSDRADVG